MTYREQLRAKEWLDLRKKILDRDNHTCSFCKNDRLLENCKAAILNRDKNVGIIVGNHNPIFIEESVHLSESYLCYFFIDEKHTPVLVGLKGISRKEADCFRAIEESKSSQTSHTPLNPAEWLQKQQMNYKLREIGTGHEGLKPEENSQNIRKGV